MSDFLSDLSSPRWWMSVVVAGIVINVFASYLVRALDARLGRTFDWWRAKRASEQAALVAEAHELGKRVDAAEWLRTVEIRQRFHSLVALVEAMGMAVLFVLFTSIGVPFQLDMLAVALFAVLWYAFIRQGRVADRASALAELVRKDPNAV